MEIAGSFKITVQGNPKVWTDAYTFSLQLSPRVMQIDPLFKFDESNFQKITYILKWWGVPMNLMAIDRAQAYIKVNISKYFNAWTYEIIVKYEEKGGV